MIIRWIASLVVAMFGLSMIAAAQTAVTLGRQTGTPAPVCIYTYGSSPSCLPFMTVNDGSLVAILTAPISSTSGVFGTLNATSGTVGAFNSTSGIFSAIGVGPRTPSIPFDVNYFANNASVPAPGANATIRIAGPDGSGNAASLDGFGGTSAFQCRRADGTAASPLPIQSTDNLPLCSFQTYGWNGVGYTTQVAGSIDIATAEPGPWSASANGTLERFRTTLVGTAGPQVTNMTLYGDGGLFIGNNGQGTTPVTLANDPGPYVLNATGGYILSGNVIGPGGSLLGSNVAPTIGSGFGSGAAVQVNNGTWAFRVNVGTGGAASSGTLTMPSATNGWKCQATDVTTTSSAVFITKMTGSTSTSVTFGNFSTSAIASPWNASDMLSITCMGD